jgi:hypothetical protein
MRITKRRLRRFIREATQAGGAWTRTTFLVAFASGWNEMNEFTQRDIAKLLVSYGNDGPESRGVKDIIMYGLSPDSVGQAREALMRSANAGAAAGFEEAQVVVDALDKAKQEIGDEEEY